MLTKARRSFQADDLFFIVADNRRLPFQGKSVHSVTSINSILPQNRSDIDPMLAEIVRVLRVGGRFIATLPAFETSLIARDHWGIDIKIDEANHREYDTTGWQCYFTRSDITELMTRHGLYQFTYERIYFTSPEELAEIRKIYGHSISIDRLLKYPLFEHFIVAEKHL
jgi:SAM-dependent methyltransferase